MCACVRGGRGEEERRGARGGAEGEEGDAGRKGREREREGARAERGEGRRACQVRASSRSALPSPLASRPGCPASVPLFPSPCAPSPFPPPPPHTCTRLCTLSPTPRTHTHATARGRGSTRGDISYLVDPASSHMLSSKAKPCMSKYKGIQARNCERLITTVVICTALSPS